MGYRTVTLKLVSWVAESVLGRAFLVARLRALWTFTICCVWSCGLVERVTTTGAADAHSIEHGLKDRVERWQMVAVHLIRAK